MNSSCTENVYLCISIDTECDHDPYWIRSNPLTFHSLTDGLPNRLQPLFNDIGAIPTYLLTVEVLEDEESLKSLLELHGRYEFGTHLHGAFVEPEKKFYDYSGVDSPDFQCNYPEQLEYEKLKNLTELFREKLGYSPTSFRAGRYGAGNNTIAALKKLGYKVDSSVTPHIIWTEPMGSVDFRSAPAQPYWPSKSDLCEPSDIHADNDVLEVPISMRSRLLRNQPDWFRPWFSDFNSMKQVVQYQIKKYSSQKNVVLNMMFHSMEIIEKASPYPQNPDEVKQFLNDTHQILNWCSNEGVEFIGLTELHSKFN